MRTLIRKKTLVLLLLLFLSHLFIMPRGSDARSSVSFYISIGVVVGGASLFFSFAFRESYAHDKEMPADEHVFFSYADDFSFHNDRVEDDYLPEVGRLKIVSW